MDSLFYRNQSVFKRESIGYDKVFIIDNCFADAEKQKLLNEIYFKKEEDMKVPYENIIKKVAYKGDKDYSSKSKGVSIIVNL